MPAEIRPNLPPEAMPWARDRDERLKNLEREMERRAQNEGNANASQNSSMDLLSKQVAGLADAVATLQNVVNEQVAPKVASGSAAGFYVGPSFADIANASIVVPDGYTRALVFASGQVTGGNDDALDIAKLYAHITINGVAGPDSISSMVNIAWASAAAVASASLAGLSGGLISVQIAARTSGGTTGATAAPWDNASLVSQAVFLR